MIWSRGTVLSRQIEIDRAKIEEAIWVSWTESRTESMSAFAGYRPIIKPARTGDFCPAYRGPESPKGLVRDLSTA